MSSKYSDEKIKVTSYGYQRSQLQNLTFGERLEIHKSHFWLHNEGRKIYIFIPESGEKNEHLIEQFSPIRLSTFNFTFNYLKYTLIEVLLYQRLQEEIIGMDEVRSCVLTIVKLFSIYVRQVLCILRNISC